MTIDGCVIDEVARLGQTVVPATVRVERADDVKISNTLVYVPVNAGSGYGVKIGGARRRVSLRDLRVEPYTLDLNHVPVNTILVDAAASGIVLTNVSTVANGGSDIRDNALDTVWINVNGVTRLRGGLAPGAVAHFLLRRRRLAANFCDSPADRHRPAINSTSAFSCRVVPMRGFRSSPDRSSMLLRRRYQPENGGFQARSMACRTGMTSRRWRITPRCRTSPARPDHRPSLRQRGSRTDDQPFGFRRQPLRPFDGGANRALVASSAVSGTGLTVMWVGRVEVAAGGVGRLFALTNNKGSDFSNSGSCLVYHSAANTVTSYRFATLTSSSITDGAPFALFVTYDGGLNKHQLTEGAPSAGKPSSGKFGVLDLVIGGGNQLPNTVGAYALACDVVEVAVWDRALPAADLDALSLYARRRWAL